VFPASSVALHSTVVVIIGNVLSEVFSISGRSCHCRGLYRYPSQWHE
jgi:hypothetical protein